MHHFHLGEMIGSIDRRDIFLKSEELLSTFEVNLYAEKSFLSAGR